jgi:hypothetical protein
MRAEKPVVEDRVFLNAQFQGQRPATETGIDRPRGGPDVRMGGVCKDVRNVTIPRQETRKRLNHIFRSLFGDNKPNVSKRAFPAVESFSSGMREKHESLSHRSVPIDFDHQTALILKAQNDAPSLEKQKEMSA